MTIIKKIKTIDKKIEQNKVQYNLDRQTQKFRFYYQKKFKFMNF